MIPRRGVFISATGTGVGKTFVGRGLARALVRRGVSVAALKPLETGCAPDPLDAIALARACGRPELARAPGFYRAEPPLAPRAVALEGGHGPPDVTTLARHVADAARGADFALIEGAGGLFVPLTAREDMLALAGEIGLPIALVAPDRLGVLSDVRATLRAAAGAVSLVILSRPPGVSGDPSRRSNAAILAESGIPVCLFAETIDSDEALADEAARSGLLARFND